MGETPKLLVPCSNSEIDLPAAGPIAREAARRVRDDADRVAARLGMSRRRFLRTSAGAATTLAVLGACSDEQRAADPTSTTGAGGPCTVPPEATTDTTAADEALAPPIGEVVVDVQTHFLDPDNGFGGGFPQSNCGADAGLCFTIDQWADLVLNSSDTSVAVLSALPIVSDDHPMSIAKMEEAKRLGEALCADGRVLLQGEAFPQVGEIGDTLDRMAVLASEHRLVAWKTYIHTAGGYSFLDERGSAFLGQVEALAAAGDGPSVVAVHQGLGANPRDLGPAAAAHPDVRFLAYHSGFETSGREGEFDEGGGGVDRLVRSLRDAGVGPGSNVYCELGSTWKLVLTDPDAAAHVLGKVLLAVGPERVLWGTDSIWYGSPQDQIQAFRAFEITPEFQERFGYPALTPELKQRIFGGNAAALHGLDLSTVVEPCRFTPEEREGAREEALGRLGPLADRNLGYTTARSSRRAFLLAHPWFR